MTPQMKSGAKHSRIHSCGGQFLLLKSIKYLRCAWHSPDFRTIAMLTVNGAENIFIYANRKPGNFPPQPMNTSVLGLESVICAPNENINPVSYYSGSTVGQATWQSSCRLWREILLPRCSPQTEAMCWPKATVHQNKITMYLQLRNIESSGLNKCQWLGWSVCI